MSRNAGYSNAKTILRNAIKQYDVESLQRAVQSGIDVNTLIEDWLECESTPLCMACTAGYDPIVRILLDAGANEMTTVGRLY